MHVLLKDCLGPHNQTEMDELTELREYVDYALRSDELGQDDANNILNFIMGCDLRPDVIVRMFWRGTEFEGSPVSELYDLEYPHVNARPFYHRALVACAKIQGSIEMDWVGDQHVFLGEDWSDESPASIATRRLEEGYNRLKTFVTNKSYENPDVYGDLEDALHISLPVLLERTAPLTCPWKDEFGWFVEVLRKHDPTPELAAMITGSDGDWRI